MKITDITVTLFAWDDIPATQYGRHTGKFAGKSDLGLVTVRTDQGIEGHAFLGSASRPATNDANLIVRALKPMLVGEDALDRERHFQRMWSRTRMNNQLRAALQSGVGGAVHVADDQVRLVAGLDQDVGAAVHADQHGSGILNVGTDGREILAAALAPGDDECMPAF